MDLVRRDDALARVADAPPPLVALDLHGEPGGTGGRRQRGHVVERHHPQHGQDEDGEHHAAPDDEVPGPSRRRGVVFGDLSVLLAPHRTEHHQRDEHHADDGGDDEQEPPQPGYPGGPRTVGVEGGGGAGTAGEDEHREQGERRETGWAEHERSIPATAGLVSHPGVGLTSRSTDRRFHLPPAVRGHSPRCDGTTPCGGRLPFARRARILRRMRGSGE